MIGISDGLHLVSIVLIFSDILNQCHLLTTQRLDLSTQYQFVMSRQLGYLHVSGKDKSAKCAQARLCARAHTHTNGSSDHTNACMLACSHIVSHSVLYTLNCHFWIFINFCRRNLSKFPDIYWQWSFFFGSEVFFRNLLAMKVFLSKVFWKLNLFFLKIFIMFEIVCLHWFVTDLSPTCWALTYQLGSNGFGPVMGLALTGLSRIT